MTRQEFEKQYQLLRQVTSGDVQTHHALAASGAVVLVHLVRAEATQEKQALLALVDRLGSADRQRILLVADVDGAPLIVTRFLLDFTTLRAWLESAAAKGPVPAAPAPPQLEASPTPNPPSAEAQHAGEPGEFTRMFQAFDPAKERSSSPAPPVSEASAQIEDAKPAGEFTAMFGSAAPPSTAPATAPAEPPPPASTEPQPAAGHGEFTGMFGAAARPDDLPAPVSPGGAPGVDDALGQPLGEPPAPPSGPPQPVPTPAPAGEFTRVFGAPPPAAPLPQESQPAPTAAPPPTAGEFTNVFGAAQKPTSPPPVNPPGDFTRVFGAPPQPPATPSWDAAPAGANWNPSPSAPSEDYLSKLTGAPRDLNPTPTSMPPSTPQPTPPPPAAPAGWNLDLPKAPAPAAGPSEFTRIISAQPGSPSMLPTQPPPGYAMPQFPTAQPPQVQAPQFGAAPAPVQKPPSKVWLIVGLVTLGVLALSAIAALVLLAG